MGVPQGPSVNPVLHPSHAGVQMVSQFIGRARDLFRRREIVRGNFRGSRFDDQPGRGRQVTPGQIDPRDTSRTTEVVQAASSNVRVAVYYPDANILHITFHSGATYEYLNINENVWRTYKVARSKGQWVWLILRRNPTKYPYRRISQGSRSVRPEPQVAIGPETAGITGARATRGRRGFATATGVFGRGTGRTNRRSGSLRRGASFRNRRNR